MSYDNLPSFVLPIYIEEDDIPGVTISREMTLYESSGIGKREEVYSVVLNTMPLVQERYATRLSLFALILNTGDACRQRAQFLQAAELQL